MGVRSLALGLVVLSACGFPMPAPYGGGSDGGGDGTDAISLPPHALTDPANWAEFDTVELLGAPRGFVGVAFDGQNLYLAPFEQSTTPDGLAVTFDTSSPSFTDPNAWVAFDLESKDINLRGFFGAIREPNGIELVPCGSPKPLAARYVGGPGVTNFANPDNWETFNLANVPTTQAGFLGGAYDGHQYVYYAGGIDPTLPGGHDGAVLRYDTGFGFGNTLGWKAFDYATQAPDPAAVGFAGAIVDRNGIVYFIPHHDNSSTQNGHELMAYDSSKLFDVATSYTVVDLPTVTGTGDAVDFGSAGFDGTYLYLPPFRNDLQGIVARYDTRYGNVTNPSAWQTFATGRLTGFAPDTGDDIFFGVAVDGHYAYFLPYQSSKLLRVDTTAPDFTSGDAWEIFDLASLGYPQPVDGYESAVYDGQYLYLIPDPQHELVLRFDATDPQALSNIYPGFTGSFL